MHPADKTRPMRIGGPICRVGRLAPGRIKHHLVLCGEIRHDSKVSPGVCDRHGGEIIGGRTADIDPIRGEIRPRLHLVTWAATAPKQCTLISRHAEAVDYEAVRAGSASGAPVQAHREYD